MGFVSILMFLLKYGPSIFQLIKSAVELIKWLKNNDQNSFVAFADGESLKQRLHGMAGRCKRMNDHTELEKFVAMLKQRKAEVEFKQRNI